MYETMVVEQVEILLVEDNPADVRLTREALKGKKLNNRLHVVSDGERALDFLYQRGEYVGVPKPDLILLDLKLPRKNGSEVLAEIKADDVLKLIPVVILTSSKAEEDIVRSYGMNANCYISKPVDFVQFHKVVESIRDFWFSIVKLPPR